MQRNMLKNIKVALNAGMNHLKDLGHLWLIYYIRITPNPGTFPSESPKDCVTHY